MSTTIDKRVVEMRFENDQFERGISQSLSSLDKLKASLNFGSLRNASGLNTFSVSLGGIGKIVDDIQNKFLSLVNIVRTTTIIKFVSRLTDEMLNLRSAFTTDQIVAGWQKYEDILKSTQTIMAATRQEWSDEAAQLDWVSARIDQLRWYADETSYSLIDMTSNVGKFTSAGIDLDVAVTAMEGISNWAAISGAGINEASRAMYNLSQAMAMGGVYLRDWMSIENANMATKEFKETAMATAKALGTLVYDEDLDGLRTLTGDIVTVENFRTTLNNDSGNWFNSEVLTATLETYGEFANVIKKATDITGIQTSQMLKYAEDYKNEMRALQQMSDETGISVSNWKKYIKAWQSDDMSFVSQISSIADQYDLSTEEFVDYLNSYNNEIIDWNAIAELEDVNYTALIGQLITLSDAEYDLGMASFKAGQESRTLTDALNYTKDAVSSGWYKTFEYIFGALLQAKDVFTTVTNELYDVFVAGGEARNEILGQWVDLGGSKTFIAGLLQLWHDFKDVLFAIRDGFREVFPRQTAEQLLSLVERFKAFAEGLQRSEEQLQNVKDGAAGFSNVLRVLWDNLKVIAENAWKAYKEIFPSSDWTETFKSAGEAVSNFAEKFRLTEERGEKVKSIFRGVFAVFEMLKNLLIAILEPIVGVTDGTGGLVDMVLDAGASFGEWLVALDETTKANDTFRIVVGKVVDFLKNLPQYADDASMALFDMHLDELWEKIKQGVSDAWDAIKQFFTDLPENAEKLSQTLFDMDLATLWQTIKDAVKEAINKIKEFFDQFYTYGENGEVIATPFDNFCKKIEEIKKALNDFKEKVQPIIDWFKDSFSFDFEAGFSVDNLEKSLKVGGLAATFTLLGVALYKIITFFDDFRDAVSDPKTVVSNAQTLMTGLSGALKSFKANKNAGSIKAVATAVLEMAAAIILLGALDPKKMWQGLYAVSMITGELTAAIVIINQTTKDSSKLLKCSQAMEAFALSLLGVAAAIALLTLLDDPGAMMTSTYAIGLLFGELTAAMVVLNQNIPRSDKMMKISESMLLMSTSMVLLAASIAMIASVGDIGSIIAASAGLSVAFATMAGAFIALEKTDVNPKKAQQFAEAVTIMSVAMVMLGFSIALMQEMDPLQMLAAAAALAILLGGMTAAIILASKFGATNASILIFAGAIALIGAGAMMAGAGLYLMVEAIEKFVSLIEGSSQKVENAVKGGARGGNDGLTELIENLQLLGGVFEAAGGLVVSFFVGLAKAITENKATLTQGLTDLWMIFVDTFKAVVPEMIDGLRIAIESFVDMLTAVWPKIETFLLMAGSTAIALLKQLILGLLDILKEAMPDILEITRLALIGVMEIVMELTPMLLDHIKMVLQGLLDIGYEFIPKITQFAIDILLDTLQRIADNIGEVVSLLTQIALETILGTIDGITAELPHIMESIWNFVITLIETFADGLDDHAVELKEAILHLMQSLWDAIREFFGIHSPSTKFFEMAGDMIQGMIDGLNNMIEKAKEAITELADKVLTAICNFFGVDKPSNASELGKMGHDIIQNMIDGISGMIAKAKEKITELADKVLTAICDFFGVEKPESANEFLNLGKTIILKFNAGIYGMIEKAKNMITDFASKILSSVCSFFGVETPGSVGELYDIAKQLIAGFIEGIYDKVNDAIYAVGEFCQDVVDKCKNVFRVASPSRVFMEIGRYLDEGLVVGVNKYSNRVDDAVEGMGYNAIDSLTNVISNIAEIVNGEMEADPTIKPVLDLTDVINGANTINNMLSGDRAMSLAADSSYDINKNIAMNNSKPSALDSLKATLSGIKSGNTVNQNNTFNISGTDPREMADEINKILQEQMVREDSVWA